MSIVAAEAPVLPSLACVGILKEVSNLRESKSGKYWVFDIVIEPLFAEGTKDQKAYFTFSPEWFAEGFDPETLEHGAAKLYRSNIAARKRSTLLSVITGERFDELCRDADQLGPEPTAKEVFDFISQYVALGEFVGDVLTQNSEFETVLDEDTGQEKREYFRTDYRSIGRLFGPGETKSLENAAQREDARVPLKICWEEGIDPFGS